MTVNDFRQSSATCLIAIWLLLHRHPDLVAVQTFFNDRKRDKRGGICRPRMRNVNAA
jgi:hypothetical protein